MRNLKIRHQVKTLPLFLRTPWDSHQRISDSLPSAWSLRRHLSSCLPQEELFQMWVLISDFGGHREGLSQRTTALHKLCLAAYQSRDCIFEKKSIAHTSPLLYWKRLNSYAPLLKYQMFRVKKYILCHRAQLKTISVYLSHNYKQPASLGLSATGTAVPADSSAW